MGETKWTSIGVSIRVASYLAFLFYISVFVANLTLLLEDQSWRDNSDEQWVSWHWVDVAISIISIIVSLVLLIGIAKNMYRLLAVFIVWAIVCLILSVFVLAFGFGEYKRKEIVLRCVGIVITAYFIDVVLSFYLSLKKEERKQRRQNTNRQSHALESGRLKYSDAGTSNEGYSNGITLSNGTVPKVCLWYEDTKL